MKMNRREHKVETFYTITGFVHFGSHSVSDDHTGEIVGIEVMNQKTGNVKIISAGPYNNERLRVGGEIYETVSRMYIPNSKKTVKL